MEQTAPTTPATPPADAWRPPRRCAVCGRALAEGEGITHPESPLVVLCGEAHLRRHRALERVYKGARWDRRRTSRLVAIAAAVLGFLAVVFVTHLPRRIIEFLMSLSGG